VSGARAAGPPRRGDHPAPPRPLARVGGGGGGESRARPPAARHADATNWQVGLDAFVHKSNVLREHCERIGRDFDSITRTHAPDCMLFDTDTDLHRWLDRTGGNVWGGEPVEEYVRDNFVGTVDKVAADVQGFVDAGCREFVLWFRDYPSTESLERFIGEVVPRISA